MKDKYYGCENPEVIPEVPEGHKESRTIHNWGDLNKEIFPRNDKLPTPIDYQKDYDFIEGHYTSG